MSFFCHWLQQEVLLLSKKFLNLFPELLHSFSFYLSPFWHIKVTLSVLENRNSPHPLTSRPPSLECVWTEVSRHSHHLTCTEYKCRVPQCPICYMGHLHRTTALFIQPCWISSEKSQLWPYFCLPPEKEWRETGKWWGVKTDGSTKSKMCRALRSEQASDRFQHSKQRIGWYILCAIPPSPVHSSARWIMGWLSWVPVSTSTDQDNMTCPSEWLRELHMINVYHPGQGLVHKHPSSNCPSPFTPYPCGFPFSSLSGLMTSTSRNQNWGLHCKYVLNSH